ncbi:MAG: nuclear transport factor 2 family protein [Proteobacteria bacterium]|nr:nuclear transport factor 2 family protein [Pseudomonadota bacterium]
MTNAYANRPATVDAARAAQLRADIVTFHAEYCAVLDRGDLEQWPLFFTEDALYRITGRDNAERGLPVGLVYCEGRAMMHDRAVAIARTQMFAPRYAMHLLGQVRVEAEGPAGIVAQTPFLLIQTLVEGPSTLHLAACYHDRFVREGQQLLLAERHVVHDTNILANDLAYPA